MADGEHVLGETAGSKTNNAEWFAVDIKPVENGIIYIHVSMASSSTLQYSLDSGTTWNSFKDGAQIGANNGQFFELLVITSDQLQIRQNSGGAVPVNFCRVHQ